MSSCEVVDRGQAAPIYITVVAGALFLALAYFAFGQAALARNGTQSAADAAALAAAHDARNQLGEGILDSLDDLAQWEELLAGRTFLAERACAQAESFAKKNQSAAQACEVKGGTAPEFSVEVRSVAPVGDSVVPGTEGVHARASAAAVLEPLCRAVEADLEESPKDPVLLLCDGDKLIVNPEEPETVPDFDALFRVRLTE
ncbi:hypothetical protein JJV70_11860 [Streptomyces sp. JJ66]|uniref:pilus assembly protein TadG-related protein n=1 Tax=Streptomyces sp. JJ66 TaxID=2803843 RepID=UPI001C58E7D3|nr:pilus assembly protein TadG-related protein [Streptomyces sp. JJ66]MBW1602791.1 hypothetical protein [Streptomyces sp. JJ66]